MHILKLILFLLLLLLLLHWRFKFEKKYHALWLWALRMIANGLSWDYFFFTQTFAESSPPSAASRIFALVSSTSFSHHHGKVCDWNPLPALYSAARLCVLWSSATVSDLLSFLPSLPSSIVAALPAGARLGEMIASASPVPHCHFSP